jgi:hypothetical protein
MALQPHAACDLFRRPTGFEPIFDGSLEFKVHNHLAMDRPALLVHVLGIQRVVAVRLWQFGV